MCVCVCVEEEVEEEEEEGKPASKRVSEKAKEPMGDARKEDIT